VDLCPGTSYKVTLLQKFQTKNFNQSFKMSDDKKKWAFQTIREIKETLAAQQEQLTKINQYIPQVDAAIKLVQDNQENHGSALHEVADHLLFIEKWMEENFSETTDLQAQPDEFDPETSGKTKLSKMEVDEIVEIDSDNPYYNEIKQIHTSLSTPSGTPNAGQFDSRMDSFHPNAPDFHPASALVSMKGGKNPARKHP